MNLEEKIKNQFKGTVKKRVLLDWYIGQNYREEKSIAEIISITESCGIKVEEDTAAEMIAWASKCKFNHRFLTSSTKTTIKSLTSEQLDEMLTKEELERMYIREKKTIGDISRELNISYSTIYGRIMRYGIQTRRNHEKKVPDEQIWNLIRKGYSRNEVAFRLNIAVTTVTRSVKRMKKLSA